jgi:hypothetical protein
MAIAGRRFRVLVLIAMLAVLATASAAIATSDARADVSHFCVDQFYYPGDGCRGPTSDWDRVRARYPGAQGHGVWACVLQTYTNLVARGTTFCTSTWSSPTWNPMGKNWGVTSGTYIPWNQLDWGQLNPHTLVGWASTNQTDG